MVCVSVPFIELHEHAYTMLLLLWYECVLFTNKVYMGICILLLNQVSCVSVSISELHKHAYCHCSLLWCEKGIVYQQVIRVLVSYHKGLLFTKFHTSKHLGKRVTQTCMFILFFIVVRKVYSLPTSYRNIGVISLIPTCLQNFIHPSIYVKELHKHACSHCSLLWCEKGPTRYQNVSVIPLVLTLFHTSKH